LNLKFNRRWSWNIGDIKTIRAELDDCISPVFHICSGASIIGDYRIDRYPVNKNNELMHRPVDYRDRKHPNILGDMLNIPFKSGVADTVVCDPPYDYNFFKSSCFDGLVNELVRILKPRGKLLFYSPWVVYHPNLSILKLLPSITGKNRSYYKVLCVSQKKNAQLGDYC